MPTHDLEYHLRALLPLIERRDGLDALKGAIGEILEDGDLTKKSLTFLKAASSAATETNDVLAGKTTVLALRDYAAGIFMSTSAPPNSQAAQALAAAFRNAANFDEEPA